MRRRDFYRWLLLATAAMPFVAHAQFPAPNAQDLQMTSEPKAPGAAAVYLYREEQTDDTHHFRTVYARLKVLSEQGREAATVHVPLQKNFIYYAKGENSSRMADSSFGAAWAMPDVSHAGEDMPIDTDNFNVASDVSALEGRTIQPDGTIVPLSGSPAQLLKITKDRANEISDISFTMPDVKVGSILEYRYQIRYDRFEQAPHWQVQQPYFVLKAHYSFLPAEQILRATSAGMSGGISDSALTDNHGEQMTDLRLFQNLPAGTEVKQEAGTGRYILDLSDIPAFSKEPYAPSVGGHGYEVGFFYVPTPDQKDFWQKQMSFWTKLENGYTAKNSGLERALGGIVSPSDAPLDKAKKIYAFVQTLENTDFNASGTPDTGSGWIPRGRVERVLETKKGGSNQIALLYLALAREAGLNARPVRIASRGTRLFNAAYLNEDQLDTVLVGLNLDGKEFYVDPGVKMAPFGTLHWAHSGAGGVAMADNKVEIIITPLQKNSDNLTLHVGSLNVSAQGAVSGTLKVAYTGQQALRLRQLALRSGADAVKAEVNRILAEQVPQGVEAKVDHLVNLEDSSHQLLAVLNVSGTLPQQGGHPALPRAFFAARESNPFPAGERMEPVDIRYPSQEQEQITYVLPAGVAIAAKPEDAMVKFEDNAVYSLKAKVDANQVTSTRVLARGFTLLDTKEYGSLRDFYQKVVSADQQQIPLSGGRS